MSTQNDEINRTSLSLDLNNTDFSENEDQGVGERDKDEFPEGGRGWLVIAGTFILLAQTFGIVNVYGQYQIYYEKIFPTVRLSILSLIGSLQPCIVNLSSVLAVVMFVKYGPRFCLFFATCIVVFGFMMLSLCKEVWQIFLAQGVVIGFGLGFMVFVGFAMPQQWFKRKRAFAFGLTSSGASIGGLVWPIAFTHLNEKVGFGWTNRIIGFIYIPLLTFAIFAVKSRISISSQQKEIEKSPVVDVEKEQVKGGSNNDAKKTDNTEQLTEKTFENAPPEIKKKFGIFHKNFILEWEVTKDARFCLLMLANFLVYFGLYPPLFFMPSYCEKINAPENVVNYILAISNAASIFGRIVPGMIGDRIGRLNTLIPCTLFAGTAILVFWLPSESVPMVIIFGVFYGMASGSIFSLYPAVIGQLFGIKGLASRLTLYFFVSAAPCLAGPSIAGQFLPLNAVGTEGFWKLMVFCSVVYMASGLCLIYLRFTISKKLLVFV